MVEAVDPSFGASGKVTVLGTNVVGLAEVIPGADLDEGNLVAVSDKSLPTGDPEVLITIEHELPNETLALVQSTDARCLLTFLLKVSAPKWVKNQGAAAAM